MKDWEVIYNKDEFTEAVEKSGYTGGNWPDTYASNYIAKSLNLKIDKVYDNIYFTV